MSKLQENSTLEALILNDSFIAWVKYPNQENEAFWEDFINQNDTNAALASKARLAVESLVLATKPTIIETDAAQIWSNIDAVSTPVFKLWQRWAAAAIVVLVGSMILFLKSQTLDNQLFSKINTDTSASEITILNDEKTDKIALLPDNSKVVLKPKSKLSYAKKFDGTLREVFLSGEAFFDIQRNPSKPFVVYANDVITKVLGTSFNVKAYKNQAVEVSVKTGKVSVFLNKSKKNTDPEIEGIVLTPNQKVVVARNEQFKRAIVEQPLPIVKKSVLEKFNFADAPVSKIFAAIKEVYGIEIVYDEEILNNCNLTTSLSEESLFQKLDIICEGIGATYKVVDAQVIINSKGCN